MDELDDDLPNDAQLTVFELPIVEVVMWKRGQKNRILTHLVDAAGDEHRFGIFKTLTEAETALEDAGHNLELIDEKEYGLVSRLTFLVY